MDILQAFQPFSLVLIAAAAFIILYARSAKKSAKKTPPGPRGWPLLGYLPYMNPRTPYTDIEKLVERYGPVVSVQMGSWNAVIIADYDLIRKAFAQPSFTPRPSFLFFDLFSHGGHGLVASNGELWHEQRRFALRHLRDLGMGKSSIETHIRDEALAIVDILKKSLGGPVDLNNSLNIAVTNIVWGIVAGKRLRHDDPFFLSFVDSINKNIQESGQFGLPAFLPWISRYVPKSWLGLTRLEQTVARFDSYAQGLIDDHKNNFNADNKQDYIDHFLEEMDVRKTPSFTELQLLVSIGDLFVAGGETTSTTLRWAVLLLSSHPEVQRRMQQEIDNVIGKDRLPALSDREHMPYTDAVIHEVQRYADIAPLGVLHSTNEDVQFEGYTIPKDSLIFAFLGHVHRQPEYWEKPYEFYPEHFLDAEQKLRKNVRGYLPFSTGKRQCLGEALARAEIFVFLTYFFQAFTFRLADEPKATLEPSLESGLIRWPSPYKVFLEPRV